MNKMTAPKPADQAALRTLAGDITVKVEQAMHGDLQRALVGNDPLLAEVLEYALFSGGKRIRPLLAVLSSRICGRNDETLYLLAAAFEYLHVATLIHDDVIDHADQRRGKESVGSKYGMAAAILAGDWLHARSMYLIGSLTGVGGLEIFSEATTAMVDGEFLQLRHTENVTVNEQDYFAVINKKTARLIGSTCEIGAFYAGADEKRQKALATYGDRVGIAFQVVDDLLDYLGDQQTTGKKVGNDFIEGKITLPLLHALSRADGQDKKILIELIQGNRNHSSAYETVHRIMEKLGGFDTAEKTAQKLVHEAIAALDVFAGCRDTESYAMLSGLAGYILARNK
ncbi:MAG: hypothetical protein GQ559_05285 [Desulfobulbaceae bacterium]|nr:hypothetical protein [Desulfobulbaceae bacterium]